MLKIKNDMLHIKRAEWKLGELHNEMKADYDIGVSRVADVQERFKETVGDNLRKDLQLAMNRFWKNEKLRAVKVKYEGAMDWWRFRDRQQSPSVVQWHRGNVQLGSAKFGFVQGKFTFPKYASWKIDVVISKPDEYSYFQGSPNDHVNLRIGTAERTLKLIGRYTNMRPPGKPGLRHEVAFECELSQSIVFFGHYFWLLSASPSSLLPAATH